MPLPRESQAHVPRRDMGRCPAMLSSKLLSYLSSTTLTLTSTFPLKILLLGLVFPVPVESESDILKVKHFIKNSSFTRVLRWRWGTWIPRTTSWVPPTPRSSLLLGKIKRKRSFKWWRSRVSSVKILRYFPENLVWLWKSYLFRKPWIRT